MKTFVDKLEEMPLDLLEKMIISQKNEIAIFQRDLKIMEQIQHKRNRLLNQKKTKFEGCRCTGIESCQLCD